MKLEEHKKAWQEHLQAINRAIDEGIEENQRNIGYNVSQAAVELFSIYLHESHIIEGSGDQWDHRTFKNKKMLQLKVPSDFPLREKILNLMEKIEAERNALCYGTRKPRERIEKMILHFQELRRIIDEHEKK